MKTLNNIIVQELSKQQMNLVKGGGCYTVSVNGQLVYWAKADSKEDVEKDAQQYYSKDEIYVSEGC
ncbi:MAG: hypothetical protein SNG69_04970 [Rikenellaceae bacterium]